MICSDGFLIFFLTDLFTTTFLPAKSSIQNGYTLAVGAGEDSRK